MNATLPVSPAPPDSTTAQTSSTSLLARLRIWLPRIVYNLRPVAFNVIRYPVHPKLSLGLTGMLAPSGISPRCSAVTRACGWTLSPAGRVLASVLVETDEPDRLQHVSQEMQPDEYLERLEIGWLVGKVGPETLRRLADDPATQRVHSLKMSRPVLERVLPQIGAWGSTGERTVKEDGKGVLIGVIDTGFDLSHPMFRDEQKRLRVVGLLDQMDGDREYTTAELETGWKDGTCPGADVDGHGTHVASICGGSPFAGCEGIAPGARFLLVRTDFVRTAAAVDWVFRRARALQSACVVNLSYGHHQGPHDGTDAEELSIAREVGPGRIVVVAAGNEANHPIHIGGTFKPRQTENISFDLLRPPDELPHAIVTLWYGEGDKFDLSLFTPDGRHIPVAPIGQTFVPEKFPVFIETKRSNRRSNRTVEAKITLEFLQEATDAERCNWQLKISCRSAENSRLDAWFHQPGFAAFHDHPFLERECTLGIPGTGDACLAVGSHVSRTDWAADTGPRSDPGLVLGEASRFSGRGPTRDGRKKPEVSAPGQYVTAALACDSRLSEMREYSREDARLATLEGTSASAPVVTGIVALLLQRKRTLDVGDVRRILTSTARRDVLTGSSSGWDPAYGYGRVDLAAALSQL